MRYHCGMELVIVSLVMEYVGAFHVHTPDLYQSDEEYEYVTESQGPHFESHEQRLMRHLVGDYDNSVRPVYDSMTAVDVSLGLTLTQILDLDEKNQVLTVNVWLEAAWFDQRLNWTASEYGGLSSIRIPCDKLWLPDIVLYNSVDDYTSGYMPSLAMVYNSSRVFWGPVIRFRSSCKIDITFFPFDTQICRLKMGSWAYTGLEVDVWNGSSTMDLSNFVDNGEWELLGVAVQRNVVFYSCCKEPFPDVTFSIQLRRRTKYYFMNIIIPCIILSFLCLGGFLLPPESGEKITLGLSVLLTITVFMLMVADKMPQTSESISVISIYLMVVLATSCLSVLSSVLVLSIHHQRGRPSRAPSWLRKLCFNIITPILCLRRQHDVKPQPGDIVVTSGPRKGRTPSKESRFRKGSKIASREEECECLRMDHTGDVGDCDLGDAHDFNRTPQANHAYQQVYKPRPQQTNTYYPRQQQHQPQHHSLKHSYTPLQQQNQQPPQEKFHSQQRCGEGLDKSGAHVQHNTSYGPWLRPEDCEVIHTVSSFTTDAAAVGHGGGCGGGGGGVNEDVDLGTGSCLHDSDTADNLGAAVGGSSNKSAHTYNLVVRYLINLIQTRQEDEVRDEEVFKEWHDIAYVLDRLLFYLFFLITLVSTVCILEMRPPLQTI